jgi:hypothetical protein
MLAARRSFLGGLIAALVALFAGRPAPAAGGSARSPYRLVWRDAAGTEIGWGDRDWASPAEALEGRDRTREHWREHGFGRRGGTIDLQVWVRGAWFEVADAPARAQEPDGYEYAVVTGRGMHGPFGDCRIAVDQYRVLAGLGRSPRIIRRAVGPWERYEAAERMAEGNR